MRCAMKMRRRPRNLASAYVVEVSMSARRMSWLAWFWNYAKWQLLHNEDQYIWNIEWIAIFLSDTGPLFAIVPLERETNIRPFIHAVISERVVHWCTWSWNWPQLERMPSVVVVLTMLTMMAFLCTRFSNVIRWFTYIHIFMFSSHIFTWLASARTARRRNDICLLNKNIFVKWTEQEEVNTGTRATTQCYVSNDGATFAPLCVCVCKQKNFRADRRQSQAKTKQKF